MFVPVLLRLFDARLVVTVGLRMEDNDENWREGGVSSCDVTFQGLSYFI